MASDAFADDPYKNRLGWRLSISISTRDNTHLLSGLIIRDLNREERKTVDPTDPNRYQLVGDSLCKSADELKLDLQIDGFRFPQLAVEGDDKKRKRTMLESYANNKWEHGDVIDSQADTRFKLVLFNDESDMARKKVGKDDVTFEDYIIAITDTLSKDLGIDTHQMVVRVEDPRPEGLRMTMVKRDGKWKEDPMDVRRLEQAKEPVPDQPKRKGPLRPSWMD